MIESARGVDRAEEIAWVEGIDILHVGANDLSNDLGVPGHTDHALVRDAYGAIWEACRRHGKHLGIGGFAAKPEFAGDLVRMGARYMTTGSDLGFLPGAVAVLASSWWRARRAVEALQASWTEAAPGTAGALPADFSSAGHRAALAAAQGEEVGFETAGDVAAGLRGAARIVEAAYDAPHLAHGQLEPPSALVRWNADGTLELWAPNQAPEMFQAAAAKVAGIAPDRVIVHSPMLGGFFGRHFLYQSANPFPRRSCWPRRRGGR